MTEKERRRLRRRVWFWRIVAAILLVVVIGGWLGGEGRSGPYIARHEILGLIFDDPRRDKLLASLVEDDKVKAVVLRIDSPGGTTAGSEALYESLREISAQKPVVAVMGEVAASGAYVAAIAADRIVARGNTLTGSIGVIAQSPNFTGLMELVGVSMQQVKSSPLKGEPTPFTEPTPEAIAAEQALVDDGYAWFRGLVAERRGLEGEALETVSDGRVFSGRQAVAHGLVDQIGGEADAIAWLEERGVESDLPVEDVRVEEEKTGLLEIIRSWLFGAVSGRAIVPAGGLRLLSVLK